MVKMKCVNSDMKTFNPIDNWLNSVAYAHSHSSSTKHNYTLFFTRFLQFIDKTASEILVDYENSDDRTFRRKYARFLRGWIAMLDQKYANKTVRCHAAAVESFFKYNDLPLAYVPRPQAYVTFHNRDITRKEIVDILSISIPREKAFYVIMAQSGLRPSTLCSLRIKHLEPDLTQGTIPCKIEVPKELAKGKYRKYFTFIGEEAIKHLRAYLKTRRNLTSESYLFSQRGNEKPIDYTNPSKRFMLAAKQLKEKGIIDYDVRGKGEPAEIRLYNLRKWFRKQSHQAGFEFVQFWMGHLVKQGQDESYRPKDVQFHRDLYTKKAMPFLRIEKPTPTETEAQIEELRKQLHEKDGLLKELKESQLKLQPLSKLVEGFNPEDLKLFISGWLETADFHKAQKAKEEGKPYKRTIKLELSEDQAFKMGDISDDLNMKLAKILQDALNLAIENVVGESDKE